MSSTLPPVLPSRTFQDFLADMIAAWAANTNTTPALQSGDPLLAIFQAVAAQDVFLESVVTALINLTRAQTSAGSDLDTWMAQFAFTRLPATSAVGGVTLGANAVHSAPVSIPAGTVVQTTGGGIQYQLIADTTQSAWSSGSNAYILPANTLSINATAQALVAGAASNVQANQLVQFPSPIAGVDTVTNPAAIGNGLNAETDSAFRNRFVLYLTTLSKATSGAIYEAAISVQEGLDVVLLDNSNINGTFTPGEYVVVVDDGSGNPPSSLLTAVSQAVGAVTAFTVQWDVVGPTLTNVTISLAVQVSSGYVPSTVTANVQTAVAAYVNALTIEAPLYISGIISSALSVPGVSSVQAGTTLINGAQSDIIPSARGVVRTTAGSVSVSTYTG